MRLRSDVVFKVRDNDEHFTYDLDTRNIYTDIEVGQTTTSSSGPHLGNMYEFAVPVEILPACDLCNDAAYEIVTQILVAGHVVIGNADGFVFA